MAIWQRVIQKFSPAPERISPTIVCSPEQAPLIVVQQLRHWQRQRQLLEVKPSRQSHYQQSLVLAINTELNTFDIDELFPNQGQIKVGETLLLRLNQGGQIQEFESTVLANYFDSTMPYYSLAMPTKIHTGQRRKLPRIAIDEDFPITVGLINTVGSNLYGSAENISAGGMRVRLAGNQLKEIYSGAVLPECEFSFPGGFSVKCRARVKGIQFQKHPRRHTSIGLSFIDLAPEEQRQIQGLIEAIHQRCYLAA